MKDFCVWIRNEHGGQIYGVTGAEILRHGTRSKINLPGGLTIEIMVVEGVPPTLIERAKALLAACIPDRAKR